MVLSSVERLIRFLCVEDTPVNRRVLMQYLYAVSNQIQAYLSVDFERRQRTEYFTIRPNMLEYWVYAIPIVTIDNVYHDIDGMFDGSESELDTDDIHTGVNDRSIVLDYAVTPGNKALKVIYTGGVSTTPTKSTFAITSIQGAFLVDKFARGGTSGAVGIIIAFDADAGTITIDNLYGIFAAGETLTMQNTEGGTDVSNISCTISSITIQSLAEILPEIPLATELQIRYNVKVKDDFELTGIDKDKSSRRKTESLRFNGTFLDIQPEVRSMINKHRRITF